MNSACNQTLLDEQSRRLTQLVIGNQQQKFNRLFYGISIRPVAISVIMSKNFRPLMVKKIAITYLDDVFMQSQIKQETFTVSEKYHQILLHENMKAAPVITFLSNTCKVSWTHDRRKYHNPIKSSYRCNPKTSTNI